MDHGLAHIIDLINQWSLSITSAPIIAWSNNKWHITSAPNRRVIDH